jgi:hypothetical protein
VVLGHDGMISLGLYLFIYYLDIMESIWCMHVPCV